MVLDQSSLSREGFHSIKHWARVLGNGKRLAAETGANLKVVELFAVFHDSRRENEGFDPDHGLRGAEFAKSMRGVWFDLSDGEMDLLFEACLNHSKGITDGDITVQTCWDADRLDLGRVGTRPDPKYLCTAPAKTADMLNWAYSRSVKLSAAKSDIREFDDFMSVEEMLNSAVAPSQRFDPKELAEQLLQTYKTDETLQIASDRIVSAKQAGDNYTLSIWREVRSTLNKLGG
jgi:uncharacterized protein